MQRDVPDFRYPRDMNFSARFTTPLALCGTLAVACLLAALTALASGPLQIPLPQVLAALGLPLEITLQAYETAAIQQIRLPRVLLALLIGAALAQAGAAMQGVFRNPLADPGLAGVSSGAALAAVAVIVLGTKLQLGDAVLAQSLLPLATFAGGALAAWCVARLAQTDGYTRVGTLLLAGLAINAIAGAGIGYLSQIADDTSLHTLTFWMFGSLGRADWQDIALIAPFLLIPLLLIPLDARALNALLLGEAEAGHVGVQVEALKRRQMLYIVIAVAASVALAGIIGFVGLIVPHLVRLWAGPDHRLLLPASALFGALLLVIADTAARLLLSPAELPIGILTALLGGPFFLLLLVRNREAAEH